MSEYIEVGRQIIGGSVFGGTGGTSVPPNFCFLGSAVGDATPQSIPSGVWTPVEWKNVPGNLTSAVLLPDKVTIRHPAGVKRASGMYFTQAFVAWENTNAGLTAIHRRHMRLVQALPGFGYIPFVVQEGTMFHPNMPNKSMPSYTSVAMQDAYEWDSVETTDADMQIQVFQDSGIAVNIVSVLFDAPLMMRVKLSEF